MQFTAVACRGMMADMVSPLSTIHPRMAAAALATLNENARKPPRIHGVTLQMGGIAPRSVKTDTNAFYTSMSGPRSRGAPSASGQPNVATNTQAARGAQKRLAAPKLTPGDIRAASAAYKAEAMAHGNLAGPKKAGGAAKMNTLA
jgi:hypothetical protein